MIPRALPDSLLAALSERLVAITALHYPEARWNDLERNMAGIAAAFGFQDASACARWLIETDLSRTDIERLASQLTIGETYFFRDPRLFAALREQIFPELIRARQGVSQSLRLWSAGCCTGEEPYSLAILLRQLLPDLASWHVSLLATDINPEFLAKATTARYSRWSFRDSPPPQWQSYFTRAGDRHFDLRPDIRDMVRFAPLNLAEAIYPSLLTNTNGLDLIICRNVLMYLEPSQTAAIIQRFWNCLVEGGWLIVSPSELSQRMYRPFTAVTVGESILYRKCTVAPLRAPEPAVNTPPPPRLAPLSPPRDNHADAPRARALEVMPALNLDQAHAAYEAGRFEEALAGLPAMVPGQDVPDWIRHLQAWHYANTGDLDNALRWCEQDQGSPDLNPATCYLRALILYEQGHFDRARSALRQTLYLDSSLVVAHFTLGQLDNAQHRRPQALVHWRHALELLANLEAEDVVPESGGLSAGRMREMLESATYKEIAP